MSRSSFTYVVDLTELKHEDMRQGVADQLRALAEAVEARRVREIRIEIDRELIDVGYARGIETITNAISIDINAKGKS